MAQERCCQISCSSSRSVTIFTTCRVLLLLFFSAVASCSDARHTSQEGMFEDLPVRCIPHIQGDAFRTGEAVTLLEPRPRALNDHCFFQDAHGHYHVLGIDADHPFQFHLGLAHGVGSRLDTAMERLPNILASIQPVCTTWAPAAVVFEDMVRIFYTDSQECAPGRLDLFAMRSATVSLLDDLSEPSAWHDQGVLFSEYGFARDPHVIWDPERRQWVMYFCRKIEPTRLGGATAVSYKLSKDLLNWSEETYDVISDVPDTQLVSGAAESPQVVFYRGYWYLFFTHPILFEDYWTTLVYRSSTPYDFGWFDDYICRLYTHAPEVVYVDGAWYITTAGDATGGLLYGFDPHYRPPGIQIASLSWILEE